MEAANTKVPPGAAWLGGLGAVPFVGLAGAMPFLAGAPRMLAAHALLAYGATILSFLGGAHWGLAIGAHSGPGDRKLLARLVVSVVPSLVAWAALLARETTGLVLLAIAIAAMLGVDVRATRLREAPPWYPKLRVPLSCVVVATLLFAAIV